MTALVITSLFVLAFGCWMLLDRRVPLWLADRNEAISRRMYALLGAEPPEYAYRLTRSVVRWVLPAAFVVAGLAQLAVALR